MTSRSEPVPKRRNLADSALAPHPARRRPAGMDRERGIEPIPPGAANPYRIPPASPWFHVLNVSGGRSSAYMLKQVLDAHGGSLPDRTEAVFANTGRERPETLDFVAALTEQWGVPVTWLEFDYRPDRESGSGGTKYRARVVSRESASLAGEPFTALLDSGAWLPSMTARVCTSELKVGTIDRHLWQRHGLTRRQTRKLIGFRFDEPARWKPALYQACEVAYPMVEAGVTAGDVAEFWRRQPFDLGIDSERGNCDCCYLKPRANLLATIREEPARADWWIEAERRKGRTFRIGESFETLKRAALAPADNGEIGRPTAIGEPEPLPLPCFCTD